MKITVCGAAGRIKQCILDLSRYDEALQVCAAVEYETSPAIGTGVPAIIPVSALETVLPETEVLIDFTNPDSSLRNLEYAKKYKVPIVIGTTGFISEQKEKIAEAAKEIPVVFTPNMSGLGDFARRTPEIYVYYVGSAAAYYFRGFAHRAGVRAENLHGDRPFVFMDGKKFSCFFIAVNQGFGGNHFRINKPRAARFRKKPHRQIAYSRHGSQ